MSYQEAAAVLRVPLGTVMSRLSRGRKALRRSMDGGDSRRDLAAQGPVQPLQPPATALSAAL
jgi:hypothetical protein